MKAARFMPAIIGLSVWVLVLWSEVRAGVIINEVLANEPHTYVTLEWIELYNDSTTAVVLDGYQLTVNGSSVALNDSLEIPAGCYLIICRRLYTDGSSRGFEDYWGDSSGVWGDTPQESLLPTPFETGLILTNTNGIIELFDGSGMSISQLSWTVESTDGVSWERLSPASATIGQSIDPDGSTPGIVNSWTPVPYDLALEDISVSLQNGTANITFSVTNRGLETIPNSQLIVSTDTVGDSVTPYQIIDSIDTGELLPGNTFTTTRQYYFDGVYARLSAFLPNDDRERNNHSDFVAPGIDFPPVILSEIMADYEAPLQTEWVEIRNSTGDFINLAGYLLGDSRVLRTVTDTVVLIEPGEYFILVQDIVAFHDFYRQFDGHLLQPSQWPPFNDDDDLVRLVDSFGFTADSFAYTDTYDNNYSFSRSEIGRRVGEWGRSEQIGGSPGKPNAVLLQPEVSDLAVTVEPAVFSPDGDGVQDEVTIVVTSAPTETDLSIRIYDRQGRVVCTLIDGERLLKDSYVWNGRSDGNRRLPVGIYILYVEAAGWGAVKKPLVIAR